MQTFTSYSEILVGNCNFSYPLAYNAPVGVIPFDDLLDFWWVSCISEVYAVTFNVIVYPYRENYGYGNKRFFIVHAPHV